MWGVVMVVVCCASGQWKWMIDMCSHLALGGVQPCGVSDNGCDFSPERPLHFAEKVLPILHGLGTDSHLVVKKHQAMEAMLLYLGRWGWQGGAACGRDLVAPGRSSSYAEHKVGDPREAG